MDLSRFANMTCLLNILFLGLGASVLILHEPFTWMTGMGTALTLAGLLLSEGKSFKKEEKLNGLTK